ncbi:uncharacterized protein LOC133920688 isoform X2 [Phragmites australis]|uniref:uncharacterized protein LOC133920688 isoform X2 n=1 Tax=Phragmites australis TaxID=29695 RepID=UPI002D76A7CD|nr:uncharacterized protein LOC133920688 isoform X2 [Phragmites australis]
MASAAGDPSPPPGGWLSGLVSGAGRLLAAVIGSESSASNASSSSPESSQSPGTADQGNMAHFASDSYQLNQRGNEIVLKDCGEGSLAVVSEIDPKDAMIQLLMQETYTRSECDALIKIIQERVVHSDPGVDEPAIVLPIAWAAGTEQDNVAYSSLNPNTSPLATSGIPVYSREFDNYIVEKKLLTKRSTPAEGPCSLNHDRSLPVLKRSYSNTGDTLEESRRVRPKLNGLKISEKLIDSCRSHAAADSFQNSTTIDRNASRGIPEDDRTFFADVPLLGTDNLTFSNIVSNGETADDTAGFQDKPSALTAQPFASTSYRADRNNRDSTIFHPYSNQVEPFDDLVPLEPDMVDLTQKNHDTHIMYYGSGSVSKLMFQEDIEAAPSSSKGVQLENSSINCTKGFNLQSSIPTKTRSPANSNRRPNNRNTIRSWNGPPQQSNPALPGQEPDAGHIQAKRPVGRPRKARRSRKAQRHVKNTRRLQSELHTTGIIM